MATDRSKQREIVRSLLGDSLDRVPAQRKEDPKILDAARVCKSHLVWQCPFKMLEGTRDVPVCNKVHSDRHRMLYQSLPPRADFEAEHWRQVARCLRACDAKIAQANSRFHSSQDVSDAGDAGDAGSSADVRMGIAAQELSALAAHGQIARALAQACLIEGSGPRNSTTPTDDTPTQACTVCGAVLSRLDNDRRLADHFVGRVHLAYARIRAHAEAHEAQVPS